MGFDNKDKRDAYYRMAKKHGYRARSVYKLMDIDDAYDVFEGVVNVVDLCAAPGSWSQYTAKRLLRGKIESKIIAVDVQDITPIDIVTCIREDITSETCIGRILEIFAGSRADLIICDGAPDVTGIHDIDEYLHTELLLSALSISLKIGRVGSSFIGKYFRNEYTPYVIEHFKKFYENVTLLKPKASRFASIECFIYSTGMRDEDIDPLRIDIRFRCKDVSLVPCGYGSDPDIMYDILETNP